MVVAAVVVLIVEIAAAVLALVVYLVLGGEVHVGDAGGRHSLHGLLLSLQAQQVRQYTGETVEY